MIKKRAYICTRKGEMAEWSNAAVLKTVEGHTSGGSNPSFSATVSQVLITLGFFYTTNSIKYFNYQRVTRNISTLKTIYLILFLCTKKIY